MKFLLDTHILLWSMWGSNKLPNKMKEAIEKNGNELWLSPVSAWEILVLAEKGRIEVPGKRPEVWVKNILKSVPVKVAPLNWEVAIKSRQVKLTHEDPADRFIVATALIYDLILITMDQKILDSGCSEFCFKI